jgi:hypothetical protein
MGNLQTNSDENVKRTGSSGALYYLGKLLGANASIDLPAQLRAEGAKLQGQPAEPLLQRCLEELNGRVRQLQEAGRSLAQPTQ